MASYLFSPEYRQETFKRKINDKQRFETFLEAIEMTEQSREDQLVQVRNLRPMSLGDLEHPFAILHDIKNETKGTVIKTEKHIFDPSTIGQLCSLDKTGIPVAYFKNSLKEEVCILNDLGRPIGFKVFKADLRQQLLNYAFSHRPRVKRILRTEEPWYRNATIDLNGIETLRYIQKPSPLVMGVLGENFPTEWSTFGMFSALADQVHDAFGNYKYESPYVTQHGTFRMAFYSKDPEWRIEAKKGDTIGFGGVLRDNPYGRGSLCWHPYALRLSCVNGMTYQSRMGSVIVEHRSLLGMVKELVKGILRPRINEETLNPLNEFEARLKNPLLATEYIDNMKLLYEHLSKVMMARLMAEASKIKARYEGAAMMLLTDYNAALERVCTDYDLGEKIKTKLNETAIKDVTIPNPQSDEFAVYDLSNTFSSYANSYSSDEQRKRYSTIAGEIIMKPHYAEILSMVTPK